MLYFFLADKNNIRDPFGIGVSQLFLKLCLSGIKLTDFYNYFIRSIVII